MDNLEDYFKRLKKYINKRLNKGHKPEHIKKTLLEHGWLEQHIQKFLEEENKEKYNVSKKDAVVHETEFDRLYNLIQEKGKVNLKDVMDLFKIDKKLAEKWAVILKKSGLIDIYYPTMGDIELRKKK